MVDLGVERAVFTELLKRHDRKLRALAYRMLRGDRFWMEDALQEAYIRAYRAKDTLRSHDEAGTWLYRIVYNTCVDVQRSAARHRHVPLEDALLPPVHDAPPPGWSGLASALDALPFEQRAAVLLIDAEGLDYAAAAEVLGIPVGTVASRLSRARASLRRDLEGRR
jgi:RNA polymerase sigma-70 factor (ECF subfamily)